MCGIAGFANFNYRPKVGKQIINQMKQTLTPRGADDTGVYVRHDVYLAHQRLSIIDVPNGHQPMTYTYRGRTYTIVYNGEIYNTPTLRDKLRAQKIKLTTDCDTELVLKCFAVDGAACLNYLQGIFAFVIHELPSNRLFLVRDPLGVKPLFYYCQNGHLAFASEIKALLAHPAVTPTVNLDGLRELFGIAPARTPGQTVYADIQEIKPATYAWWQNGQLTATTYWRLQSRPHTDDVATTATKLRDALTTIVQQQLASNVPLGTFLSGGLDSSIITALASRERSTPLKTFSVDYVGNAENFVATDFTPSRDNQFIDLVAKQYQTQHQYRLLNTPDLYHALRDALHARDYPAMADIDSSLLLFCGQVKPDVTVCLSGEFADEIFCGYPWFYRADTARATTFPWSINTAIREQTIAKPLRPVLKIKDYMTHAYQHALSEVPLHPSDSPADRRMKTYSYLTMRWFGLNLLERTDRMAMHHGLEVRVPFTDTKLVQYVYNVPWVMKNHNGYEKGILRYAFRDLLPDSVVYRKKCPYPKTVDPAYTRLVEQHIGELLNDEDHPLWQIVDQDYVAQIWRDHDGKNTRPWFGQLMNRPQYLAFIIQIALWLTDYHIVLDLHATKEPKV